MPRTPKTRNQLLNEKETLFEIRIRTELELECMSRPNPLYASLAKLDKSFPAWRGLLITFLIVCSWVFVIRFFSVDAQAGALIILAFPLTGLYYWLDGMILPFHKKEALESQLMNTKKALEDIEKELAE